MIDISNMDAADVLRRLYNRARCSGGAAVMHYRPGDMSLEEAREVLAAHTTRSGAVSFDYVYGRVIKVVISDGRFNPYLYDRDHGKGAAAAALGLTS
jgi:hypothetical protein